MKKSKKFILLSPIISVVLFVPLISTKCSSTTNENVVEDNKEINKLLNDYLNKLNEFKLKCDKLKDKSIYSEIYSKYINIYNSLVNESRENWTINDYETKYNNVNQFMISLDNDVQHINETKDMELNEAKNKYSNLKVELLNKVNEHSSNIYSSLISKEVIKQINSIASAVDNSDNKDEYVKAYNQLLELKTQFEKDLNIIQQYSSEYQKAKQLIETYFGDPKYLELKNNQTKELEKINNFDYSAISNFQTAISKLDTFMKQLESIKNDFDKQIVVKLYNQYLALKNDVISQINSLFGETKYKDLKDI
ncbi:hypothetical protein [Mycoplasmopsis adleri]|uniref:hypothetical protein n=1 Tax=Mycoplasmopsis adleri TaxID=51362 RepID=UPI0038737221